MLYQVYYRIIFGVSVLVSSLAFSSPAWAQFKLGIGGPMTGASATFGTQLQNGGKQAAEDINAKGGILNQRIEISVGDDEGDPRKGVSVANKFVGDGVKAVVGHFNSGVSIPASEVYEEYSILQITPASTQPLFTERGLKNTFRTCGRDDQQGFVAAEYIVAHFKDQKVAVLHDKTTYGKGLADETKKSLNARGFSEVLYEGVNAGEKDYSALVSKLKAAGVELVYWGGLHTEAALILRQMRDQGMKTRLMGGDGLASTEYAALAGPAAEGTLMTFGPDPTKRPQSAEVIARLKSKNINPESYTLYSYAAVEILKQAIEKAKSFEMTKVADVLHSGLVFNTVLGSFSYDSKGDRNDFDYVVYIWKKNEAGHLIFEEIKS